MKKFYLFLIVLVAGILIGTLLFFKIWNRPKKNISLITPDVVISSREFASEFEKNKHAADVRFKNKIIELSGKTDNIETDREHNKHFFFNEGDVTIQCTIDKVKRKGINNKPGEMIHLKGRYVGMDTLLGVTAKFYECIIIDKE